MRVQLCVSSHRKTPQLNISKWCPTNYPTIENIIYITHLHQGSHTRFCLRVANFLMNLHTKILTLFMILWCSKRSFNIKWQIEALRKESIKLHCRVRLLWGRLVAFCQQYWRNSMKKWKRIAMLERRILSPLLKVKRLGKQFTISLKRRQFSWLTKTVKSPFSKRRCSWLEIRVIE